MKVRMRVRNGEQTHHSNPVRSHLQCRRSKDGCVSSCWNHTTECIEKVRAILRVTTSLSRQQSRIESSRCAQTTRTVLTLKSNLRVEDEILRVHHLPSLFRCKQVKESRVVFRQTNRQMNKMNDTDRERQRDKETDGETRRMRQTDKHMEETTERERESRTKAERKQNESSRVRAEREQMRDKPTEESSDIGIALKKVNLISWDPKGDRQPSNRTHLRRRSQCVLSQRCAALDRKTSAAVSLVSTSSAFAAPCIVF